MRLILAGSRSFGKAVYEALLKDGNEIIATWSPPIGLREPRSATDALTRVFSGTGAGGWQHPLERSSEYVRSAEIDLIVCAHLHEYLGAETCGAAKFGAIGYHPSLLPRHRGRDAVHWTIHMRDPIAGGTVYRFDGGVDTGPIILQRWCHVDPAWSASDLWRERLFPMGVDMLVASVRAFRAWGEFVKTVPQDERFATWEPSLDRPSLKQKGATEGAHTQRHPQDRGGITARDRQPVGP